MRFRFVVDAPKKSGPRRWCPRPWRHTRRCSRTAPMPWRLLQPARKDLTLQRKAGNSADERRLCRSAATGSATTTDVQLLVELLIQFLLLGIVGRHLLLFGLFCRRARRKMLGPRLQMTDGCGRHRGWVTREWFGGCVAENHDTADNRDSEKRAHGLLHWFIARGQLQFVQTDSRVDVTCETISPQNVVSTKHRFSLPAADHTSLIRPTHYVAFARPRGKKTKCSCDWVVMAWRAQRLQLAVCPVVGRTGCFAASRSGQIISTRQPGPG
jgi:hypothetical protein